MTLLTRKDRHVGVVVTDMTTELAHGKITLVTE